MDWTTPEDIASALEEMHRAKRDLARGSALLTTTKAVALSRVPISAETLIGYPYWVMPRIVKNPKAKRLSYMFDPRDLLALPRVLYDWQTAVSGGQEDAFARDRMNYLLSRDVDVREAA